MSYGLLIVAAVMFGLYNVFIKLSADHISAVLGAVVLQFVAAFVGLGLLLYLQASGGALQVSGRGLGLATLAGIAIGLVEILTFVIYGRGIPVAVGNPLIIGGSLLVTTGIGVLLLRELLSPLQLLAILAIASGVGLLAWDAAR
jgi:transporter family protein